MGVSEVETILVGEGFNELELNGDEINGWQVDFWYKFSNPEKGDYTLSGSLFYGGFALSKN